MWIDVADFMPRGEPRMRCTRRGVMVRGGYLDLLPCALVPRITLDNMHPPAQCNNTPTLCLGDMTVETLPGDVHLDHSAERRATRIVWTCPSPPPHETSRRRSKSPTRRGAWGSLTYALTYALTYLGEVRRAHVRGLHAVKNGDGWLGEPRMFRVDLNCRKVLWGNLCVFWGKTIFTQG